MSDNQKLEVLYFQVTDVWKRFCEEHTLLLDKTFEEYAVLLGSEIDKLDGLLEEKAEIIARINQLEDIRAGIIKDLSTTLPNEKIESVTDLLRVMDVFEKRNNSKHLFRFNALLIDIIEKIQTQNKKNQLFINKAVHSLQTIRDEAMGVTKKYNTYNAQGGQVKNASP